MSGALSLITTLVLFKQVSVWHRQDGHLQYFSPSMLGYPGDLLFTANAVCTECRLYMGCGRVPLIPADGGL